MEFPPTFDARLAEIRHYQRWRDRYAYDGDRCRWYESDRYRSPIRGLSSFLDTRMVRQSLADLPPGSLVLDLPCGGGRISRTLSRAGWRPVAADFSPWMLTASTDATPLRVRADALQLPFRNEAFAAAICFRFMQAVPFELRLRVLREFRRVSRRVVVNYQNIFSLRSLRRFVQHQSTPRNRLSEAQVRAEIETAGLEILTCRYKARLFYEDFVVVAERAGRPGSGCKTRREEKLSAGSTDSLCRGFDFVEAPPAESAKKESNLERFRR